MTDDDIVVIGAGPAGLAISACLHKAGLPHTVLERETEIGSAWRSHYDRLHLHTTKRYSAMPYTPWPAAAPRYPSRQQVVDYLESYKDQHNIVAQLGVRVQRVSRKKGKLLVETDRGTRTARCVVVATGYNGVANRPDFPGLEQFNGSVVHTAQYKNPHNLTGKKVLVVGCGNSGAEIALDLAEQGVDTSMVVRGPVHVIPRDLMGRPSQETGIALSKLPISLRDAIISTVMRFAVGDLSRWGIVRPKIGPQRMIEEQGRVPMLDVGTVAMIKAGKIRVVPAVSAVLPDSVQFADGTRLPFDTIILATGFKPGLGAWIDGFDAIADVRGRPDRFGSESGIPGLYFVGFKNPPTGALREIAIEAQRAADSIKSLFATPLQ